MASCAFRINEEVCTSVLSKLLWPWAFCQYMLVTQEGFKGMMKEDRHGGISTEGQGNLTKKSWSVDRGNDFQATQ